MNIFVQSRASFATIIFSLAGIFVFGQGVDLDCDPCIERPSRRIQAIVHGTSDDIFWQRLRASSIQAGKDMRVDLHFELYDIFDPDLMAADIIDAATGPNPPDALIVTIPSTIVENAVREAAEYVPIFGMNSGYQVAKEAGVLDFVAMDEQLAGEEAAAAFLRLSGNITKALFVNHEKGNIAIEERLEGFRNAIGSSISVDELVLNMNAVKTRDIEEIKSIFEGCEHNAILLGGSESSLSFVLEALDASNCSSDEYVIGGFDTGEKPYAAIATGKLSFAISQQSHLQGTLSVFAAATYATTEKKLSAAQGKFGTYLSGPFTIDINNLPSDTLQACEAEAFPVCTNTSASDDVQMSSCGCHDRSKVKIGGVLHGLTTDPFWDVVFEQAIQAADDLGIELKLDRMEPQPSYKVLHAKMAQRIISLCQEGVDGLFVTIPSDLVHPAIKVCQGLNVPIVSVNSGAADAKMLGISQHISQLEYEAGYKAGERMAGEGVKKGVCLFYEEVNTALLDRCEGFEAGMKDVAPTIEYLGNHFVPFDSQILYMEKVEALIAEESEWDGLGALSIGQKGLEVLVELKKVHPNMVIGTFDTNNYVFDQLDTGMLLFGIDQNAFMQGSMPVWLLAIMDHTKQHLQNQYIMSGPSFVDESPSDALKICTANQFEVCPRPVNYDKNQLTRIRPVGLVMAGILISLSIYFSIWVGWNINTAVVRKSQPVFLVMICFGTFLMAATIIPMSIDDSIASEQGCTKACMATPWLLSIGFNTCFSALYSKLYRIKKLIESAVAFRRVTITTWDVMRPFCVLFTLTVVFLVVWTFADPRYWNRNDVPGFTNGLTTYGTCVIGKTYVSKVMLSCLIILAFVGVILACIAAWNGRQVSVEFSESTYVGMVIIGMLQVLLLGIPLIALVNSNPPALYFVISTIIFVLSISILLLIFVPKILFLREENENNIGGSIIGDLRVTRSTLFANFGNSILTTQDSRRRCVVVLRGGITKGQMEDLKKNLENAGTIDDHIDLQSLIESTGIIISDYAS